MWSFWEQQAFIGTPDFLVVGGGIVGLSSAIALKESQPQKKVLVVESGPLPSGASTKNAGFACFGSPSELLMDLEKSSIEEVFALVKRRFDGLSHLRKMLDDKHIKFESPGSFELFKDKIEFEKALDHLQFLNKHTSSILGFSPFENDWEAIDYFKFQNFNGAIRIKGEGQLDTGLMMKTLIEKARFLDVEIISGLKIESIEEEENHVLTIGSHGNFKARKVIIATNGFAKNLLPELEVESARAQVMITEPIKNLKIKGTFHFDRGYYYFRNVDNRLLFGGGRNLDLKGEATSKIDFNHEILHELRELLRTCILPNTAFKIDQNWAGIMGLGHEKSPIVKKIGKRVACAVRLGGMGVAIGSLVGKEAAELFSE